MEIRTLVTAVAGIAALMTTASIRAAEIKVIASNGVKEALHELAPSFERETGHKLVISFGLATALKRQIDAGETLDPAPLPTPLNFNLAQQRQVGAGAPPAIARPAPGLRLSKQA